MIVLDTNVVSESMKPEPSASVLRWLDAQVTETLFITTVTVAGMRFGIGALPEGRRRQGLTAALEDILALFDGRILPFDIAAANAYADLAVAARTTGRGFPTPDGYIAAIAAANGFTVASRDASAFRAGGVDVIDPWA